MSYYIKHGHKDPVIDKSHVDHLILRRGTFYDNSAAIGGGIYSNTSRILIETTDFQHNYAQLYGGGISTELSCLCLKGRSIFLQMSFLTLVKEELFFQTINVK